MLIFTSGLSKLNVVPNPVEPVSSRPSFESVGGHQTPVQTGRPTFGNHTTIGRGARAAVCMHIDRLADATFWLYAKKFAKASQFQRWSFVS